MFTERAKLLALAIVHIFETAKPFGDYSAVAVLTDGAGLSVGVSQFTHKSGSLRKVLLKYQEYLKQAGQSMPQILVDAITHLADQSAGNIKKMGADMKLRAALRVAGHDPLNQKAQQYVAFNSYLKPAIDDGEGSGFSLPMSLAVIYDSHNQGGWIDIRDRVTLKRESFNSDLTFEKAWITQFVQKRDYWLEHSRKEIVRNSDYRTDFFLAQIARGNWNLDLPISPQGFKLTEDMFDFPDDDKVSEPSPATGSPAPTEGDNPAVETPAGDDSPTPAEDPAAQSDPGSGGQQPPPLPDPAAGQPAPPVDPTVNANGTMNIEQILPSIKNGRRWLGGGAVTAFLATISAKLSGMPPELVFFLGFLCGVLTSGLTILVVMHYHGIVSLVKQVVDNNAQLGTNNIQLVKQP